MNLNRSLSFIPYVVIIIGVLFQSAPTEAETFVFKKPPAKQLVWRRLWLPREGERELVGPVLRAAYDSRCTLTGPVPSWRVRLCILHAQGCPSAQLSPEHLDLFGCDAGETALPAPPSDLQANVLSSEAIDLTWTINSDDETGFYIESAISGDTFSTTYTAPAGHNAITIGDLNSSTEYQFRVCALRGIDCSAYSNTVSAETLPEPLNVADSILILPDRIAAYVDQTIELEAMVIGSNGEQIPDIPVTWALPNGDSSNSNPLNLQISSSGILSISVQAVVDEATLQSNNEIAAFVDLRGTWVSDTTVHEQWVGCEDSSDNGTMSLGIVQLEVYQQSLDPTEFVASWSADGISDYGARSFGTGSYSPSGELIGEHSYSEPDGTRGNLSFHGEVLSADQLKVGWKFEDTLGDTCSGGTVNDVVLSR